MKTSQAGLLCIAAALLPVLACGVHAEDAAHAPKQIASDHLHNAFALTEKVISGAQPEDAAAFDELKKLGVKTIISVDGATPEVRLAKAHGLAYMHLPIGYDGVPKNRAEELAKAILEQPGKIYVHCHHGKHRGPAAAAVALCITGDLTNDQALAVLKVAHTGENYKGLWASAREAQKSSPEALKALQVTYVEAAKIPPLAEAMVNVDLTHERIEEVRKAGWRMPKDHPDLDPPHEALQLKEYFRELQRTDDTKVRPDDFKKWMKEGEDAAESLEKVLRDWKEKQKGEGEISKAADEALTRINQSCSACHNVYRNAPKTP